MTADDSCPSCLSVYRKIHGMIYPVGSYIGNPCTDDWHRGPDYQPEILDLTEADLAILSEMKVRVD